MPIPEGIKKNLKTLMRASELGDLGIIECKNRETGKTEYVIFAANFKDSELEVVPLAKMFTGNPYEELITPMEEEADAEKEETAEEDRVKEGVERLADAESIATSLLTEKDKTTEILRQCRAFDGRPRRGASEEEKEETPTRRLAHGPHSNRCYGEREGYGD